MKFTASRAAFALSLAMLTASGPALAEVEWISITTDNDLFVGNDNGYTNGIFVSWYDGPEGKDWWGQASFVWVEQDSNIDFYDQASTIVILGVQRNF